MNERVVKLLIESGLLVNASEYRVNGIDPKIKKFAELLVKECIAVIENESMGSSDEWENGLHIAVEAIKHNLGE